MKTKHQFVLIFFSFLFFTNVHAQDERKLYKGFHLHFKNAFYTYGVDSLSIRQSNVSYSFGYHMTYDFNPKVGIRFGARFSGMNVSQLSYYVAVPCSLGSTMVDPTASYVISHHRIIFVGIPVSGKVKLTGGKNHIYLTAGAEAMFNLLDLGYQSNVRCGNITSGPYIDNRIPTRFLVKLNGGIGAEIEVSKKLKVFFEPQFEYTLGDVLTQPTRNGNSNNTVKAVEIGMMVGIKF